MSPTYIKSVEPKGFVMYKEFARDKSQCQSRYVVEVKEY